MHVPVGVTHGAAVNNYRMIQQRSISILRRLEILDEVGELLHVVAFDFLDLLDQFLPLRFYLAQGSATPPGKSS